MESTLVMYGIKNCDTIKKARKWLDDAQIPYRFHDYKKDGISTEWLTQIVEHLGWQILLNTRGTTWRKLSEQQRATITTPEAAIALMLAQPSIIKRPLLIAGEHRLVGFNPEEYQQFIAKVN